MTSRLRAAVAAFALACAVPTIGAHAQSTPDHDAVRRAVLDYVEGFYEGDSTKHLRSIRPEVHKYGFSRSAATGSYAGSAMSWAEFHAYTRRVREQNRRAPATARKEIVIYDVQDQTAVAKLTATWGTDYLTLAKYDGKWMVVQVLWQTPMPAR